MRRLDDHRVPVKGEIDVHPDAVVIHPDDYELIGKFVKDALADNRRSDEEIDALKALQVQEWVTDENADSCDD